MATLLCELLKGFAIMAMIGASSTKPTNDFICYCTCFLTMLGYDLTPEFLEMFFKAVGTRWEGIGKNVANDKAKRAATTTVSKFSREEKMCIKAMIDINTGKTIYHYH
jgi:hypothetical protein